MLEYFLFKSWLYKLNSYNQNYSYTSITKYKLISSKFDRFYHGSDKQYYSHALAILP